MSEGAFWFVLVLIAVVAVGVLLAALIAFEHDGYEPIEHEVDEP